MLRGLAGVLRRNRVAVVMAVLIAATSSSTTLAASFVLGAINTTAQTTTLRSGVNGTVLQVTNTNGTGKSVKGLSITVPNGRAPVSVNSGAGKATNLNADRVDGLEGSALAKGSGVTIYANRLVIANANGLVPLLTIPGFGTLNGLCSLDHHTGVIVWRNSTSEYLDVWHAMGGQLGLQPLIVPPNDSANYTFASHTAGHRMFGGKLVLGRGVQGTGTTTATIDLFVFRANNGSPCSVQATATVWKAP